MSAVCETKCFAVIGNIILLSGFVEKEKEKKGRKKERKEERKFGSYIISDTALVPCGSVRFYLVIYLSV